MGANAEQTLIALREAEAYPGPSLVLAYSHCIAHGFDLRQGMKQQALATASGYWPLFRYDPSLRNSGANPFRLDSTRPRLKLEDFAYNELRYSVLTQGDREAAAQMMRQAQAAGGGRTLQNLRRPRGAGRAAGSCPTGKAPEARP